MKNYKVKAIINFDDKVENVSRRLENESTLIFYCDKERYEFLKEHNAVQLIEIEKKEEVKPKKTTKKK